MQTIYGWLLKYGLDLVLLDLSHRYDTGFGVVFMLYVSFNVVMVQLNRGYSLTRSSACGAVVVASAERFNERLYFGPEVCNSDISFVEGTKHI